ncbi:hypothetical protein EUGRSUZ_D01264 [Eucalyptus grandis]|uniref:Uncharacterized protein n=2 Tax=Eucalyptus grandis TaxID=71139 RepID=A0ACC3L5N9_EUCGR|nr:hypothetical protein EUGRSUZ_D01264 [Eucalyptus grandis]
MVNRDDHRWMRMTEEKETPKTRADGGASFSPFAQSSLPGCFSLRRACVPQKLVFSPISVFPRQRIDDGWRRRAPSDSRRRWAISNGGGGRMRKLLERSFSSRASILFSLVISEFGHGPCQLIGAIGNKPRPRPY